MPARHTFLLPALCLLGILLSPLSSAREGYLAGRGIADVTGPLVGVQFWGFGRADQLGEGLHLRLWSRAFVIAEADRPESRLVFVSVDLGSIDHHMVLTVLENLRAHYGDTYGLNNVIISATHTHAGPSGYWQSSSENALDGGFYPQHYDAVVAGITASIVQAHEDLQPARVLINSGRLGNAGVNRSAVAYQANPAEERARYADNTNTTMTVLRFVGADGDLGMISWYALHPTAMNYYNRLVSGDHKGFASRTYEQELGASSTGGAGFVAAFAQSDPGDVTPNTNLDNTGPGDTDTETTRIMGQRQIDKARALFESASEELLGPIASRQVYVNLDGYQVEGHFTGQGPQQTCSSAYGYSFAGGSTEDGGAHFLFYEGMTEQSIWRDWLIGVVTGAPEYTEEVRACHAPKPILFDTGSQNPPLQSQVHTVSLARIGQMVILAMPGEVTTMSGRRLRNTVAKALGDWAAHVVLAGYANEFAGYITTPEEYELQQYEAAHNLHGRWSLPAYQQVASVLATDLEAGGQGAGGSVYDDRRGNSNGRALPVHRGSGEAPGALLRRPGEAYSPGETVQAEFLSVDPNAYFVTGGTYLEVLRHGGDEWVLVATDADWSTRVRWQVDGDQTIAILEWDIPQDTPAGRYRLRHKGHQANGTPFQGESAEIAIVQ